MVKKISLVLIAPVVFVSALFVLDQSLSFEETLEKMMDIAGVKSGMIIGEIGSGGGPFTFRLAERVGKNGKIYANDIVQKILHTIEGKGIQNIETVLGEIDDPVFPVMNLDMVIMRSVFHDLENPLSMLENIKSYLKPEAPLVIIEQLPSKYMPIHVMTKDQFLSIVKRSSFELAHLDAFLPYRWIIYMFKVDEDKGRDVWTNWLDEFRAVVTKAQEIEGDRNLSSVKKRIAWERILNSYRDNNPDTDEDEQLRDHINKRINLLKKHGKQSAPTADKETLDTIRTKKISIFHLRTEYESVDMDDINDILQRLGFRGRRSAESGDFKNLFESVSFNGDNVVVDKASGLMWHQSGSEETLDFFAAQEWIDDLNIQRYAGYSDWRLPTVEEAASLFESKKMNGEMQIDPVFSDTQSVIWTGDAYYPGRIWLVLFRNSSIWEELKTNTSWVRPVRSVKHHSRIPTRIQSLELTNSIAMKLRLVKAGRFIMGSDDGGPIGQSKPAHEVTLTYDYYLGIYEVTQSQYQKIMKENPSDALGPDLPVAGVTFEKAEEFCKKLSHKEGVIYRLPYEAEWEYAYRAGSKSKYPWGDELRYADDYGWHEGNSCNMPHPVGMKKPNNWGFYDMSGNVQEFTRDFYGLYKPEPVVDPKGASKPWGTLDCTLRGGSYELAQELFNCSFRHGVEKDSDNPMNTVGFRIVREIE